MGQFYVTRCIRLLDTVALPESNYQRASAHITFSEVLSFPSETFFVSASQFLLPLS
jgi:hypothetical protein